MQDADNLSDVEERVAGRQISDACFGTGRLDYEAASCDGSSSFRIGDAGLEQAI